MCRILCLSKQISFLNIKEKSKKINYFYIKTKTITKYDLDKTLMYICVFWGYLFIPDMFINV